MASMVIRDDEAESARVTGRRFLPGSRIRESEVHVMSAEPYLSGLILVGDVLGELRNGTAHQHNRSMKTRRWRNGS
jgi:hypothetical protein